MPSHSSHRIFDREGAPLRVRVFPQPITGRQRLQQAAPAFRHPLKHLERRLNRAKTSISEFGPLLFGVCFRNGLSLRERQLNADIPVGLCISDVMDDLAHGPAAGMVRSIELLVGQSSNRRRQICWGLRELAAPRLAVFRAERRFDVEATDWVTNVGAGCHGRNVSRAGFRYPVSRARSSSGWGERLNLDQTCKRFLQLCRKLFIRASNLAKQSINHNPESSREFVDV
jgi:hypothetical protein